MEGRIIGGMLKLKTIHFWIKIYNIVKIKIFNIKTVGYYFVSKNKPQIYA